MKATGSETPVPAVPTIEVAAEDERRIPPPPGMSEATLLDLFEGYAPRLGSEWAYELHAWIMGNQVVEPYIRELVRLRCANFHTCRTCASLRWEIDGKPIADDDVAAVATDFEESEIDERGKVALRFTDAFVAHPWIVSDELRADLRASFTEEQIVSLALDIMKWSTQKVFVALRYEPATPALFSVSADGEMTVSPLEG